MNLKPFNLEKALAGATVVTREGKIVKMIKFHADNEAHNKISGIKEDVFLTWYANGKWLPCEGFNDLFIIEHEVSNEQTES